MMIDYDESWWSVLFHLAFWLLFMALDMFGFLLVMLLGFNESVLIVRV